MNKRIISFQIFDAIYTSVAASTTTFATLLPANGRMPQYVRIYTSSQTNLQGLLLKPYATTGTVPTDAQLTQMVHHRPLVVTVSGCDAVRLRNPDTAGPIDVYISTLGNQ